MKILWLAPNLNHYKYKLLNKFNELDEVNLVVISGRGSCNKEYEEVHGKKNFKLINVRVNKRKFAFSLGLYKNILGNARCCDWILVPMEKKNLPVFMFCLIIKNIYNIRLVSYNHEFTKSNSKKNTKLDKIITAFYFKNLDKVIFYTKETMLRVLKSGLINEEKIGYANNALETGIIEEIYNYHYPPKDEVGIVFLGRLVSYKRVDMLIDLFEDLSCNNSLYKLDIIGDGPDSELVRKAARRNRNIQWHGTITDERKIMPLVSKASAVIIPGRSGLSINHAFAYGRPFITFSEERHGPEIDYLSNGVNGYILNNVESDQIRKILTDHENLRKLCDGAWETAKKISSKAWVDSFYDNLKV